MGQSFSNWLIISEVFRLDQGRVLTLAEAITLPARQTAQDRIAAVQAIPNYQSGPHRTDHIEAAVVGLKPAAIVRYDHHPENPAAAIVSDAAKKRAAAGEAGEIQAELLRHGIKVRPDFHIIHMNFPGYSASNIIVGGRAAVEELWIVLQCQYYLDLLSSGDTDAFDLQKVTTMLRGQCHCPIPSDPQGCKPVHRRIGQLLGYSDKEVDDFVSNMAGYNHMPDVEYPFELPSSLANVPKKKGFSPNEWLKHSKGLRNENLEISLGRDERKEKESRRWQVFHQNRN